MTRNGEFGYLSKMRDKKSPGGNLDSADFPRAASPLAYGAKRSAV
jgi:hypothetical protein